ncbi:amidohydrolase family protein [Leptospira andrefontaineae]|uniref:Cytosine deaminase n=1 Tax=Leptospira andrefontaineae TaxID=2484976 RepID=A0A4R9GZ07_9LEPT|nr:amidohydrolase family protein [Leptospira andrefontaineae]TGK36655.1 cytosine deaminase [Leptospira andrefontaineae]
MKRILLRGAVVVTMSPNRPDSEHLDILIEDGLISKMDPHLEVYADEIVDFKDRILIPGLINAHIHSWQAALRCAGADWTLLEYLANAHAGLSSKYNPKDMYIAALFCALNQINCGTTTIGDWCHNARTPTYADQTIQGLDDSGIRAVYFNGTPHRIREAIHPIQEIDRLMRILKNHKLISVGMAIPGPQYSKLHVAKTDLINAKDRDIIVSMHQSGGLPGAAWKAVLDANLIGPHVNIVHGCDLPDEWIRLFVQAGATFTSTPENELSQGHGLPLTGRLLRYGTAPSIGTDTDTVVSGEVLVAARIALAHQRGQDHQQSLQETGLFSASPTITSKDALSWLTVEGARALGLADSVGRLEPGMQADIVAIDTRNLNLWPAHDPVATALQANMANIEAVMIAGRWRKREHTLIDVDTSSLRSKLFDSGQRLLGTLQSPGIVTRLRQKVVREVLMKKLRKKIESL